MRLPLLVIVSLGLIAGLAIASPPIRLGFYNVENLYDTINDPSVDDAEFLPTSPKKWNSEQYAAKVSSLAAATALFRPDVLGVCEIENRGVLEDLIAKTGRYNIVHYDSRDARGIDVALLYDTSRVDVYQSEPVRVGVGIRDFLRVDMAVKDSVATPFSIYVVHLPSKRGGALAASRRRIALRFIDSIAAARSAGNIIFCGDFNDAPQVWTHLDNAALEPAAAGRGSYAYGDRWTMIDQFLISFNLRGEVGQQQVVVDPLLITPEGRFAGYPRRGSPSDHLPVYLDFYQKK